MGYTHYWIRDRDLSREWKQFIEDVDGVYGDLWRTGNHICGWDGDGEPIINSDEVSFNGCEADDEDCESFTFPRVITGPQNETDREYGRNRYFRFCKTCRKPYDLFVTSVLVLAKWNFGSKIEIHSDGYMEDWGPTLDYLLNVLEFDIPQEVIDSLHLKRRPQHRRAHPHRAH